MLAQRSRGAVALVVLAVVLPLLAIAARATTAPLNFTVDDVVDQINPAACGTPIAGQCSLREAIIEADQAAASGPVQVNITVPAGTYVFDIAKTPGQPDSAAGGDLVVSPNANVTINGAGASTNGTVLNARGIDRQFFVFEGGSLTLDNLYLENGTATTSHDGGAYPLAGGSVLAVGSLTATDVVFDNNVAPASGGAIQGDGVGSDAIQVGNAYFLNNTAGGDGGGISTMDNPTPFQGESLNVSHSYLQGNRALGQNSTLGGGGGIAFGGSGSVVGSTFVENTSLHGGGGVLTFQSDTLLNDTFTGNAVDADGLISGGGVASNGATSTIEFSTFVNNSTVSGGSQLSPFNGGLQVYGSYIAGGATVCDPRYPLTDLGGNQQTDSSCFPAQATVSQTGITLSPVLGTVAAPIAVMPTFAPPATAIGTIALGTDGCGTVELGVDELGNPRPNGTACDAGAVETSHAPVPSTILSWGNSAKAVLASSQVDGGVATGFTPVVSDETGLQPGEQAIQVAGGSQASFALTNQGRIYSWGDPLGFQLGVTTSDQAVEPGLPVPLPVSASAVAAFPNSNSALAVGVDHNLYGWGNNTWGQLGTAGAGTQVAPQRVGGFPPGTAIRQVSVGGTHDLALSSTGAVYAWGNDDVGQLGPNAPVGSASGEVFPVPLALQPGETLLDVAAGQNDSFALTSQGRVLAWGGNNLGALGIGSATPATSPQPTLVQFPAGVSITAIAPGGFSAVAMSASGLYTWGDNGTDELGTGSAAASDPTPALVPLPQGYTPVSIGSGGQYVLAEVATPVGDQLLGWGDDGWRALGNGTNVNAPLPTQVFVPPGLAIQSFSPGYRHALAIVGPPGASTSVSLTTSPTVNAGAQIVPEASVNPAAAIAAVTGSATSAASTPLGSIPLASIPLASIPLGSIPLASIPLASIPLASIPLSEVPLNTSAGTTWAAVLSCAGQTVGPTCSTADANLPQQSLTLTQVLALPQVQALPLASINLSGTPLASIPLASIALGSVPLASIPIPGSGSPAANWCAIITAAGRSCAAGTALDPTSATLLSLSLAGVPLGSIPLGSISLGGVLPALEASPSASPLGSIPLGSISLGSTPLGSIPLASIDLSGSSAVSATLAAIPLASIPLASIPLGSIPLGSIPLASIPLASIPLGSIPLASIPLGSIPLASIPAGSLSQLIACQPGSASDPCALATLGQVPSGDFAAGATLQALCATDDQAVAQSLCLDANAVTTLAQLLGVDPSAPTTTLAQLCAVTDTVTASPLCGEAAYTTTLSQLAGGSPSFGYGGASLVTLLQALPPATLNALLVGDLLTGLLPRAAYPWQQVNLASAQLQQDSTDGGVATYTAAITVTGSQTGASLAVTLPPGFAYRPGTSALRGTPAPDPAISGATLTWALTNLPVGVDNVTFQAASALTLGLASASASVSAIGSAPAPAATATTTVTDAFAPGYHNPATPRPLALNTLNLGYVSQPGVDDWFSLPVSAGQELSLELSNLPADDDLTLYGPPATPLQNPPVQVLAPVADPSTLDAPAAQSVPPVAGGDVALVNQPVYAVSDNRGTTNEVINTSPLAAGTYLVEVSGYNAATSPDPFLLRAEVLNTQAQPACVAPRPVSGQQPLLAMPATLPANVNTIFLANTGRLAALYSTADAQTIIADAQAVAADRTDGVVGAVIPVETTGTVAAGYAAWDANRCSVATANQVVAGIANVVDNLRKAYPSIANIVILGDDSQVPMARVPDGTTLSNETGFAQDFTGPANELTAAEAAGDFLTDDVYANPTPLGVGSGSLFLPEIAIGRLVSTPAQIEGALQRFVASHADLNDTRALSTGYDFLASGADAVAANLGLVPARTITQLTSQPACTPQAVGGPATGTAFPRSACWTAGNLSTALNENPSLAGLNAHFDPQRLLPALGNQTGNQATGLFATTDLRSMFTADPGLLTGSLLFSMGCHAGLELPPNEFGQSIDSWDQTFADEGAIWVANTGYGYGDTASVALSALLMADFAANLNESMTIGNALTFAKQAYNGGLAVVSPYDMKVLMESTFYGMPMYHLRVVPPTPAPRATGPTTTVNPLTGVSEAPASARVTVGTGLGQLALVTTTVGNYYQVNATGTASVQATEYRPLQPKLTVDITQPALTGTGLAQVAHGAVLTGLTSQDVTGFTPKIVRPVIDSGGSEPPLDPADATFPTQLQNVTTLQEPNGTHQQLVIVPGQFNSATGTERLFTSVSATVEYANPADTVAATDFIPPTIVSAQGAVIGANASFRVSVTAGVAAEPVRGVVVLFTSGNGAWSRMTLTPAGGGIWTGVGPAGGGGGATLAWFVQAVDAAGNVAVASDKGAYFAAPPVVPAPGSVGIAVPPAPPGGVYPGPVPATLTVTGTALINYTLDGVTVSGVASGTVVTVTGGGVHVLQASVAGGAVSTLVITIAASVAPTVSIAAPVTGAALVVHQVVTTLFTCLNATTCTAVVDGSTAVSSGGPLPATAPGVHTLVVTGANSAGVRTARVTYTVGYQVCMVQEPLLNAKAPTPIAVSLCDALGVNLSVPAIRVTATTLDGKPVPPNGFGPGPTTRVFVYIPPVPPNFPPPKTVLPSYGYQFKGLAAGPHTLTFIAGADPIPHSLTFTLLSS